MTEEGGGLGRWAGRGIGCGAAFTLASMYEASIETIFSATHALRLPVPEGAAPETPRPLEPVHGHDWPVRVTVGSAELDDIETVMDFHELEAWVAAILEPLRGRHLNDVEPFGERGGVNPSAERVAWYIGTRVVERLKGAGEGGRVVLVAVSVGEAAGCTATWRP